MRLLCLFSALIAAGLAQTGADPEYKKLREAQVSETFAVDNVTIRRDVGVVQFKSGTISFGPAILGKVTLGVFTGEADLVLAPAVPYERDYIRSILGQESVRETFDRAVFYFTDATYEEIKTKGKPGQMPASATNILKDMRDLLRKGGDSENMDAEILTDLYNPKRSGAFNAYLHGRKYSDLRFALRPRGSDLGAEEVLLVNLTPGSDAVGILYSAHLAHEYTNGKPPRDDKRAVAAENYKINTSIARNEHLSATSQVRFRAVNDGDRLVRFDLMPRLRVSAVRGEQGPVAFIQEDARQDSAFHVILPEPTVKDRRYQLTIEYAGDKVVEDAGGGNFAVGARTSWYPSLNAFADQATYDVSFRVPRQYTLVSIGKKVEETRDGDIMLTRWVSEVPIAVAGFNYGEFKRQEVKFDNFPYIIEGYAASKVPDYLRPAQEEVGGLSPARLLDQALAQTRASIQIYDQWFGRPPYGRIAITQQPEFGFGQSWPGLVYLPVSAFLDSTQRWQLIGAQRGFTDFIDEVTPHEVAHQWWGHMVGWESYRDQWLSEGIADFSAGLYLQLTQPKPDKYLHFLDQARDHILSKNQFGRTANEAGPLTMGQRLNSPKNPGAYASLVYPKGGYVLHMLRTLMWDAQKGDAAFIAMMRDFVAAHLHKNASTVSFQAVVEKHMTPNMNLAGNGKMDWFFDQWVYGTDVPRYKFDYELLPAEGGKARLKGSLAQSGVSDQFRMPVPIYLDLDDGRRIRLGDAKITGNSTLPIDIVLPQKPKKVLINANYDVLAYE